MEDSAFAFPDWAHLPLDVVHLISEKVKCITDYVRFCAVCSPWRSTLLSKPQHLPLQLPWLMIPYSIRHRDDDGIRLFYNLWEAKMHKIHLPETIGKTCCASYHGWLLLVAPEGTELFLLNPLTRACVQLPSFTTPVKLIWDKGRDKVQFPLCKVDFPFESVMGKSLITKVTFSADLTDPDCLIMVFIQKFRRIFFCKLGDSCWTQVVLPPVPSVGMADAAYRNGSFYYLYEGFISNFDLNQHKVQDIYFFRPELQSASKFFLEGKSGIYVVAVQYTKGNKEAEKVTERFPQQKLELYQLQVQDQEQRMKLKRIVDTSDTTIFYGDNYHYLAVRTDDWDSIDGGCMYVEYRRGMPSVDNDGGQLCYNIFSAKLDDGNLEPVVLGLVQKSPILPLAPAVWFQPSLI